MVSRRVVFSCLRSQIMPKFEFPFPFLHSIFPSPVPTFEAKVCAGWVWCGQTGCVAAVNGDVSRWDVSSVTSMAGMFHGSTLSDAMHFVRLVNVAHTNA
mmetsp:Transcript_66748/g.139107  ORF Transcript_66748/g.139107 Transcript_66748/m.139107 type:complete len:99 (+) Transcript_66748:83-379(+)